MDVARLGYLNSIPRVGDFPAEYVLYLAEILEFVFAREFGFDFVREGRVVCEN